VPQLVEIRDLPKTSIGKIERSSSVSRSRLTRAKEAHAADRKRSPGDRNGRGPSEITALMFQRYAVAVGDLNPIYFR
jgi:ribosomal protein L19E